MISEVHNMDCMEFMATIPDKYFSLSIADPPYGLDQFGVSTRTETEKKEIVYVGLKRITIDDSFVYFYDTQTDVMYLQSRSSGNVIQLIECTGKPMLYHKHFRQ